MKFNITTITFFLTASLLSPLTSSALEQGQNPPEVRLKTQYAQEISLNELKGKVVYLDFWATWCGPCKETLPWMQQMQTKYKSQGLEVVAINIDKSEAKAKQVIDELGLNYQIAFDSNSEIVSKFDLPKMPTSFLIDRSGKIAFIHAGFKAEAEHELEAKIVELLNQ